MIAKKCKVLLDSERRPYLICENTNIYLNEEKTVHTVADLYQMAFLTDIIRQAFESIYIFMFDTAGHFLMMSEISRGGLNTVVLPIREICQTALLAGAASVIVIHNHPSGSLEPSEEDIKCTTLLYNAFLLVGLTLDDHVIVSYKGYHSFKANDELTTEFKKNIAEA